MCHVTSARILEDKLVECIRSHSCEDVRQRGDCGILAPVGFCPPDANSNQSPTQVTGGVCGH